MKDSPTDSTIRELEAESVAYVVARRFGLAGLSSPNYIALHGDESELIMGHIEQICKVASNIIHGNDKELSNSSQSD